VISIRHWLKKLRTAARSSPVDADRATIRGTEPAADQPGQAEGYSADQPIRSKDEDRFNRWPFAKRIAETLAARRDPSGLVIAIYGPWGDGKTSTLLLMEAALKEHEHVVAIRFNPWHFDSEEQLLRGFFATLAEALGRSLPTKKEELGRLLNRYGGLLSIASVSLAGIVQIGPGNAAKSLGEALSTVELDDLRSRLEKFLDEEGKRVVALIDDIDRLDRREIQAIFRLVKLSAGFAHTSYVLAFDDGIVAASLGERYGAGGVESGRAFLEKIVQVPLHLPPPDELALRRLAFQGVDEALSVSGISLTEEQVEAFVRHFVDGLEPRMSTPRHAKLYGNGLLFALPILKGEVNPVDQMLIEGIRIFYPRVYETIRDNPEYFLKAGREAMHDQALKQRAKEVVERALEADGVDDKDTIRSRLLEILFPRLKAVFGNTVYGSDWDGRWEREQRVCAGSYFHRYFRYGIPPGDIADLEVAALLDVAGRGETEELNRRLAGMANAGGMGRLIPKLRRREDLVEPASARQLALAICRNGALVPRERAILLSDWTFMQAAILVLKLVGRIPAGAEREQLALQAVEAAEPLPFAWECMKWFRKDDQTPENERVVSAECETELARRVAERIRAAAQGEPLYQRFGADAPRLLWLWNRYGEPGQVGRYLEEQLNSDAGEVDVFLATYAGKAWGFESGLSHKADLERDAYDAIAKLIDPEIVMAKLKAKYGAELNTPEYYLGDELPYALRLAHQFAYIHQRVKQETQPAKSSGDVEDKHSQDLPGSAL
jgi:predicted KAP-like P-loop ATPase